MERNRMLTLEEGLKLLSLWEWADSALTDNQKQRLQQLLEEADGVNTASQARYLYELTRLSQPVKPDLARLLSMKALESAEDPAAWIEGDTNGLVSRYWGYEAFLEANANLRIGTDEERNHFFSIAEKQVALGPDMSERLRQRDLGPSLHHSHAGYYYQAEQSAHIGDTDKALALVRRAKEEGWAGNWSQLEQRYNPASS